MLASTRESSSSLTPLSFSQSSLSVSLSPLVVLSTLAHVVRHVQLYAFLLLLAISQMAPITTRLAPAIMPRSLYLQSPKDGIRHVHGADSGGGAGCDTADSGVISAASRAFIILTVMSERPETRAASFVRLSDRLVDRNLEQPILIQEYI